MKFIMKKCINCGLSESAHATPKKGDACFKYQASNGESWFWLSFADANLPEGSQFLGAAIVEASNLKEATQRTWAIGINPGGEIAAQPIPDDKLHLFPVNMRHRLLTRAEAKTL